MELVFLLVLTVMAVSWFGEEGRSSRNKLKKYVNDHPPRLYAYEYLRACELCRLYQDVPECRDAIGEALEDARTDVYTMGYLPTNVMNMSAFQTGLPEVKAQPHQYTVSWPIAATPIRLSFKKAKEMEDGIYGARSAIQNTVSSPPPKPKYQSLDDLAADREFQAQQRFVGSRYDSYLDLMDEWYKYLLDNSSQVQFKPWPQRDVIYDLFKVPEEKRTKQTYYEGIALSPKLQEKLRPAQIQKNEWLRKRAIARKKFMEFGKSEHPDLRDFYEAMKIFPPKVAMMTHEEAMAKFIQDQKRLGFYHPADEVRTWAVGHDRKYTYYPLFEGKTLYLLMVSLYRMYNADPVHHKHPQKEAMQKAHDMFEELGLKPSIYELTPEDIEDPPYFDHKKFKQYNHMSDYLIEVFRVTPGQTGSYQIWEKVYEAYLQEIRKWEQFLFDTYPKVPEWSEKHAKRMELLELLKLRLEISQA